MFPFSKYLQVKLSANSDEAWKEREAAVLTLGAIAEGCINGLAPHLPEVFSEFVCLSYEVYSHACRIMVKILCLFLFQFQFVSHAFYVGFSYFQLHACSLFSYNPLQHSIVFLFNSYFEP